MDNYDKDPLHVNLTSCDPDLIFGHKGQFAHETDFRVVNFNRFNFFFEVLDFRFENFVFRIGKVYYSKLITKIATEG